MTATPAVTTLRQAHSPAPRTLPSWLRFVAPIVVGVLILALWSVYVATGLAPRMLPAPSAIGAEFVLRWDIISSAMLITAAHHNARHPPLSARIIARILSTHCFCPSMHYAFR